jgi:hypothetical protein
MRQMVLQNQAMFGSVNSGRRHFEVAMRRLAEFQARWPHETERIVTHVFAPEEVEVAYKLDGPQVIKKVLDWTAKGVPGDGAP